MVLKPDLSTFAILPWDAPEERTARLICTVHTPENTPFIGDPRTALINVLKQAEAMGLAYKTGMELEFFLFRHHEDGNPLPLQPHDEASYFDVSTDLAQTIRRKMLATLNDLGIRTVSAHHEIGSGQHDRSGADSARRFENSSTAQPPPLYLHATSVGASAWVGYAHASEFASD
jgi:glutamine synthetase